MSICVSRKLEAWGLDSCAVELQSKNAIEENSSHRTIHAALKPYKTGAINTSWMSGKQTSNAGRVNRVNRHHAKRTNSHSTTQVYRTRCRRRSRISQRHPGAFRESIRRMIFMKLNKQQLWDEDLDETHLCKVCAILR